MQRLGCRSNPFWGSTRGRREPRSSRVDERLPVRPCLNQVKLLAGTFAFPINNHGADDETLMSISSEEADCRYLMAEYVATKGPDIYANLGYLSDGSIKFIRNPKDSRGQRFSIYPVYWNVGTFFVSLFENEGCSFRGITSVGYSNLNKEVARRSLAEIPQLQFEPRSSIRIKCQLRDVDVEVAPHLRLANLTGHIHSTIGRYDRAAHQEQIVRQQRGSNGYEASRDPSCIHHPLTATFMACVAAFMPCWASRSSFSR